MRFRYGNKWATYPISPGETWEAPCGSKVAVADIMREFPAWMRADIDMVYVDPPWSQGNLNAFLTKAEVGYHVNAFGGFLSILFSRIAATGAPVCYCECGRQNLNLFEEAVADIYPIVQFWPVTYYRKHPCFLIRGGETSTDFDFEGMDEADTPAAAIAAENPDRVADMCAGQGLTALASHRAGKVFLGTELNKWRLAVLIDRAAKIGVRYAPCTVP